MTNPNTLTIWEAQFGDFSNGAQIMLDQYISAAEDKWKLQNGLVMLLPHGYEGQGAEHSSARMERYLQLCSRDNMFVADCTTPANLYHLFRRQMKAYFRKPLIVFTPKSLLRHPKVVSSVDEFANGSFQMLIQDSLFLHLLSLALQTCQSHAAFPKLLVDVLPVLPMLLMTHCIHLTLSRVADCLRSASSKTTGRTCCIFCAN